MLCYIRGNRLSLAVDPDRLRKFIRLLQTFDAQYLLEGHGEPITKEELLSILTEESDKL